MEMPQEIATSGRRLAVSLVCSALCGAAGCSSVSPPVDKIAAADLAVRQAETSTASQYAPLPLRMAREKLEAARRAMDEEEYQDARRLAEQALVDAQLAQETAASAKARAAAEELQQSIETLRQEAQRGRPSP
jgi:Domain of unknown function (DUF4398)